MVDHDVRSDDIATLRAGRGFVELADRRVITIAGDEAVGWLHDLLTADIAGLPPGEQTRSLLLTPTGYVRADVHVVRRTDDVLLVQDRAQAEDVGAALAPYVLSSDVRIDDAGERTPFSVPGAATAPDRIVASVDGSATRDALVADGLREVTPDAAEAWRIVRGVARMGPDFDTRSLPAEARLDAWIDATKGCFLGQESVARIRNLGHPPRVLRHVQGDGALVAGDPVERDGEDEAIGQVTSATSVDGTSIALVRVAWSAATARLTDTRGHPLRDLDAAG
jgi:tRNA-modifying protein YgfZ